MGVSQATVALPIPREGFASFSDFFRQLKNSGYQFSEGKNPKLLENVYFFFKENDVDEDGRPKAEIVRETDLVARGVDVSAKPADGIQALAVWEALLSSLAFGYPYAKQVHNVLLELQAKGIIK